MQPQEKPKVENQDKSSKASPRKRNKLTTFARVSWAMVALILLGIALLVILKFDIGRLRGAAHYVEKGRAAVDAKDWTTALSAIQKVEGEARTKPEFLQLVADFLKGTRADPVTLATTLTQLDTMGQLRGEDFLWLCRASLAAGNAKAARVTLDRIPEKWRGGMEAAELRVAVLRAEGRTGEADTAEQQMLERFANHPKMAVLKAMRELNSPFPEVQTAALERLWEFTAPQDEYGLRALRVLARRPNLSTAEVERLKVLIDLHPLATPDDFFNATSLILKAHPDQRESILNAAVARHKDTTPEGLQQLTGWLAREKEYARITKMIPTETWSNSRELFPAVAQGLAQQQKWQELMDLLKKDKKLPVSATQAAGWRALAAKNLYPDNPGEAIRHLTEAIQKGGIEVDGRALLGAALLAEEWGMTALALQAYLKLAVQGSPQEAEMLEKCWQIANLQKDAGTLMKIATRLTKLRPDNLVLLQRQDYLRLLCGREVEMTLTHNTPSGDLSDTILLLQALKAYRMHDLGTATLMLRKIQSTTELSAGERAVYAGLLVKTHGDTSRAFQIAEKILPQLLLSEENEFLKLAF